MEIRTFWFIRLFVSVTTKIIRIKLFSDLSNELQICTWTKLVVNLCRYSYQSIISVVFPIAFLRFSNFTDKFLMRQISYEKLNIFLMSENSAMRLLVSSGSSNWRVLHRNAVLHLH